MQKTLTHLTLNGHTLELENPDPKVVKFIERVEKLATDPRITERELVALVYSRENPLVRDEYVGDRAVNLREVAFSTEHRILADIIQRKDYATRGVNLEKLAAGYTLSAREAAELLGMHENGVRRAAHEGRLASWVKDGRICFHPKWVKQFGEAQAETGKRGRKPEGAGRRRADAE